MHNWAQGLLCICKLHSILGPPSPSPGAQKAVKKKLQITWNKVPDFPIILFHFWLFGVEGHMYVESFADQYYKPVCRSQTQRRLQWPPWSSSRPQAQWWWLTRGTLKQSQNSNPGFLMCNKIVSFIDQDVTCQAQWERILNLCTCIETDKASNKDFPVYNTLL